MLFTILIVESATPREKWEKVPFRRALPFSSPLKFFSPPKEVLCLEYHDSFNSRVNYGTGIIILLFFFICRWDRHYRWKSVIFLLTANSRKLCITTLLLFIHLYLIGLNIFLECDLYIVIHYLKWFLKKNSSFLVHENLFDLK